jgi:hypothetical protein
MKPKSHAVLLITSKALDARRRGATTEAYGPIRRKEERSKATPLELAKSRLPRGDDALMVDQGKHRIPLKATCDLRLQPCVIGFNVLLLHGQSKTTGGDPSMLQPGTRIQMTKGYRGVDGEITAATDSDFELYLIELANGIRIVAGPSAFVAMPEE